MLVEINSETDFVARGDVFKTLVDDMSMQIAASQGVAACFVLVCMSFLVGWQLPGCSQHLASRRTEAP